MDAKLQSLLGLDLLFDSKGNLLQVATPLFARGRPESTQTSLMGKLLARGMDILESRLVQRLLVNTRTTKAVRLVTPRLLRHDSFRVVEHDLVNPMPGWVQTFDLIRIANVLNLSVQSQACLRTALKNVAVWLKDDGYLVVCRTGETDALNHGTVYCKRQSRPGLILVQRIGAGSELNGGS